MITGFRLEITDDPIRRREEADQAWITSAFLGVLAAVLLSIGALAIAKGDFGLACFVLAFALTFAFLAYQWPHFAPRLAKSIDPFFSAASASAWSWVLLFAITAAVSVLVFAQRAPGYSIQLPFLAQESTSDVEYKPTISSTQLDISGAETLGGLMWQNDWARGRLEEFSRQQNFRAKQSETEAHDLMAKGNQLLQIIRKGVPLFQQWQALLTVNPERVCLGLDLSMLAGTSSRLSSELHEIQTEQQKFFDQNATSAAALLPLLNNGKLSASSNDVVEFELAAASLVRYTLWMRGLANHSTCDHVVQTGEMAIQSLSVTQALWRLGFWLGETQDRIQEFQAQMSVSDD
jgi:hypothetical protein